MNLDYNDSVLLFDLVQAEDEKWQALEMHRALNTPVDSFERQKSRVALLKAEIEWVRAVNAVKDLKAELIRK